MILGAKTGEEEELPRDIQQSVARVLQSICITSPVSFAFPSHPPDKPVATGRVEKEEGQKLTLMLRDTLYARCFARSTDSPTTDKLITVEDFCRRLSAANQGRDAWLPGWRVENVGRGGVIIVSQGRKLRFSKASEYVMTLGEDVRPCVGCGVTLRVRKESLMLQDDTYCALGEESSSPDEEANVLRIYFNAPQRTAISIVELVTRHFNAWCVPFTLKIMLRPEDRDRSDATVLYFPKNCYPRFVRLLSEFPASFFDSLRANVPLCTKLLRRGIGLAENPNGSESFGRNRCRLIAEGLVQAWLEGRQDFDARIHATEQRFLSEGFSLARPYLNPGSQDTYNTRLEEYPESQKVRRIVVEPTALTVKTMLAYMREQGLCIETDTDWQVSEYFSRNRNFAITRSDSGRGFFVKQLRVQDVESFAMMQREATTYRLAQENPDFHALRRLAPRFVALDNEAQLMILEFIGSESFAQAHLRLQQFPAEFGHSLGVALATLHAQVGRQTGAASAQEIFLRRPPGIFDAHRNGPLMRWLGPGQRLLIAQVRANAQLAQTLDELAASWRRDTFIHGDIKFENCIAVDPQPSMMMVDWELSDFGEPAWDIGSALQSYLAFSLLAAPILGKASLKQRLEHSPLPLHTLKAAIQRSWQSYCRESLLDHKSRQLLLERSLRCAAARMMQTVLELTQGQTQPPPLALMLFDAGVELISAWSIIEFLGFDEA